MKPPTTSQLRRDVDSGRTGDKVAAPDPATVPLGTDEEAAGTPIPPEAVAQARERELQIGRAAKSQPDQRPIVPPYAWPALALVVAVIITGVLLASLQ